MDERNAHEPKKLTHAHVKALESCEQGNLVLIWWTDGPYRKPYYSLTGGAIRGSTLFTLWLAGYIEQCVLRDRLQGFQDGKSFEADRAKLTELGKSRLQEHRRKSREITIH